jgi:hypothetical protein
MVNAQIVIRIIRFKIVNASILLEVQKGCRVVDWAARCRDLQLVGNDEQDRNYIKPSRDLDEHDRGYQPQISPGYT